LGVTRNIRVHELARELGMTNAELLALCEQMGVGVKTDSSTLIEQWADQLRRQAEREGLTRPEQPGDRRSTRRQEVKREKPPIRQEVRSDVDPDGLLAKALEKVLASNLSAARDLDRLAYLVVDAAEELEAARLERRAERRQAKLDLLIEAYEGHRQKLQAEGRDLDPDDLKRLEQLRRM